MAKFKKNFKSIYEEKIKHILPKFTSCNVYCQDESHFGLHTITGRVLTAKGIKPVCPYQHKSKNTYLYGAFSPINGDSVMYELPYCNNDYFEFFLKFLSDHKPMKLKIVVLDKGVFHKAKCLKIPETLHLFSYSHIAQYR